MPRRARLTLIVGAVLVAALLVVVLVVRSLLAPERFTALAKQSVAVAGLQLHLDGPAQPALWPRPAVAMDGLRLSLPDDGATVVSARQLRLVVPWRGLFSAHTRIERLELDAPSIDLATLRAWQATRNGHAGAPALPTVSAGVHITNGELHDDGTPLLDDVALDTGALQVGHTFALALRALDMHGQPLSLDAHARPTTTHGIILDPLRVQLRRGVHDKLDLDGRFEWHGTTLKGAMAGRLRAGAHTWKINLAMQSPDALELSVNAPDTTVDLKLPPRDLWQWWQQVVAGDGTLPMPPAEGRVQAANIELAGWHAEGVRVELGPAAAASVAPPASTARP